MDILTVNIPQRIFDLIPSATYRTIGVADGKSAALIFLSLRSQLSGCEEDRERAQKIFLEIIEDLADGNRSPDRMFLTGDPGAVRSVSLLTELGLIEADPAIDIILRSTLERRNFVNTIPSIPMPDPDVYGEAIAFLSIFREDDYTLGRYSLQEYLVSLTDNCLRLLTESVPPLYSPSDMRPSFMHSILRFALGILEQGIFPSKATRIVDTIRNRVDREPERYRSDIDGAILRSLLGDKRAIEEYIRQDSQEDLLPDMARLSLFSMAYSCPHLLAEGIEGIKEETFLKLLDNGKAAILDSLTAITLASGLMYLNLIRPNN